MLFFLTTVFVSLIFDIGWEIGRLAFLMTFSIEVTVPAVCHSDG